MRAFLVGCPIPARLVVVSNRVNTRVRKRWSRDLEGAVFSELGHCKLWPVSDTHLSKEEVQKTRDWSRGSR